MCVHFVVAGIPDYIVVRDVRPFTAFTELDLRVRAAILPQAR
jgi:hypothetical protein